MDYANMISELESFRSTVAWQFPVMAMIIIIAVLAIWLEHRRDKKLQAKIKAYSEIYTHYQYRGKDHE